MRQRLLVAGNGMAGMHMVETLLQLAPMRYDITVIGREPHGNYNRVLLSPLLAGETTVEQTLIHDPDWYHRHGITLRVGETVEQVNIAERTLRTDQRLLHWDRRYWRPDRSPAGRLFRQRPAACQHVSHAAGCEHFAGRARSGSGGRWGYLGIEAAAGLQAQGRQVTLIHRQSRLLDRQLDIRAGELLLAQLRARGIRCELNASLAAIRTDSVILHDGRAGGAAGGDGHWCPAGDRPAQAAGIPCQRGILVDRQLRTAHAGIYAVGECCEISGETFGLVAPCLARQRFWRRNWPIGLREISTVRPRAPVSKSAAFPCLALVTFAKPRLSPVLTRSPGTIAACSSKTAD